MPGGIEKIREKKLSPREKLDNHARELLFKAQDLKNIKYRDDKWDLIWIGANRKWTTMEMTINKVLNRNYKAKKELFDPKRVEAEASQYTLRVGPKGYELITKKWRNWEKSRKLTNINEIIDVLKDFEIRFNQVEEVKLKREIRQRLNEIRLADVQTEKESNTADLDPYASLDDMEA